MENKNFYDVIVIGGGPGGYGAALYTSRANLTTLVVEKFAPGGQMGTTEIVENYPGFTEGINGFELGMQMKQGAERFGVETKIAEVQSVDFRKTAESYRYIRWNIRGEDGYSCNGSLSERAWTSK